MLAAAPAHAESPASLLQKAVESFGLAQFDTSRQLLEQARAAATEAAQLARIHLYLGFNAAVIGELKTAREAFTAALTHDPTLRPDPRTIKRELINLFDELRGELRGTLTVRASAPSGCVLVDGKDSGQLPLTSRIPIGPHRVEVRGLEGETFATTVVVMPGRTAVVVAEMKARTSRLAVRSDPPGAEAWVDGKRMGQTPVHAEVATGEHQVVVRTDGHHPWVQSVAVAADRPTEVRAALVAVSAPSSSAPPRRRLWTWISAGATLATLVTGVGIAASSAHDFDDWQTQCQSTVSPSCADLERTVRDKDLAANVMFGMAGGLAVTSVVLFFLERPVTEDRSGGSRQALSVTPLVGPTGGALRVRF